MRQDVNSTWRLTLTWDVLKYVEIEEKAAVAAD